MISLTSYFHDLIVFGKNIFAAQEALYGLKLKVSQSIIIGGITGSGKTETAKHIIEFLCETTASDSNIAKHILASNPILESFANAETTGNRNSSRFCKFVQVNTASADFKRFS